MKKIFILILLPLACLFSCSKASECESVSVPIDGSQEVMLYVGGGFDANVETKATAISSVPGTLWWGATTGRIGNRSSQSPAGEAVKWSPASAAVSSNVISTGKYQTYPTATAYNYYVSNKQFSITPSTTGAAGKAEITVANNNDDVIAGKVAASSSGSPVINLEHIFARTGSFSASLKDDNNLYELHITEWKIVGVGTINGTAGTYNMSTGAWTNASTKLTTAVTVTNSSDLYLIPGTYSVSCTYYYTRGDFNSGSITKSATVTLQAGKINNISANSGNYRLPLDGTASEIQLQVTLSPWTENNITDLVFN